MKKEFFDITGMSCSACSARVHKAVSAMNGVKEVSVNLLKNNMAVSYDPDIVSDREIVASVEKAGYGATIAQEKKHPRKTEETEIEHLKKRLIYSLVLTVLLMCFSMAGMFFPSLPAAFQATKNPAVFAVTQLLLAMPVVFINADYFKKGFKTLLAAAPNMDSLIALGSGAAIVFSVFGLYKILFALAGQDFQTAARFAGNLYFESAVMILTLITLGRFLEERAKGKTAATITGLLSLAPQTATVIRNGKETTVPTDQLTVGDEIIVKAGERIAADGVIVEGSGILDESSLTGES